MAKQASKEFTIDGVNYLLASDCEKAIWPKLCDRVEKHIMLIGKESAKSMYGCKATTKGCTTMCNREVVFHLTINPEGNPFR